MSVARLDPIGALSANPLAVLGAVLFALAPLLALTTFRPRWTARTAIGVAVALMSAEVWQLARFGFF
jgi:hypothetical protein